MRRGKVLCISTVLLLTNVATAQHPMKGDCKGDNPKLCELTESDILPKQGHPDTHPQIEMSVQKRNSIHVKHMGGKDFRMEVRQVHEPREPSNCSDPAAANPFRRKMPYNTDSNKPMKEFFSKRAKTAAIGCSYELWMTERNTPKGTGDPHIIIDQ